MARVATRTTLLAALACTVACASSSNGATADTAPAPKASSATPEISWPITVGESTIHRVVETEVPMAKPKGWFSMATDEGVAQERAWLEPRYIEPGSGRLIFAIQSLLIKSRENVVVVETANGVGNKNETAPYLDNLRAAGVNPEDVDYVIATHLHFDHIGWNVRMRDGKWVPTFPNAKYLFVREEWEHWKAVKAGEFGYDAIQKAVVTIFDAGLAQVVEADFRIDDEVSLVPMPGHTPGHVVVRVSSGGRDALVGGDVFHHPLQAAQPQWQSKFEILPDQAKQTRQAFLDRYVGSETLVIPAHFPTPSAGRVVRRGSAFRFE